MDRSQDKTVVLTPQSGGGGGSQINNALPIGYVLQGRYVIEAQLGAGGFGITYLAKHRYLEDIWVAIKEYLPEGAAVRDESSRVHAISEQHDKIYSWGLHRFLDEARLLRQFKHPNIVAVEDFFEANDTAYLVMNHVRGRSIQDELDKGRQFTEQELRNIIYQLLDALNLIHRDGLFHRDISPDNILLREDDDSPVLIDFGSARYEMRMRGAEKGEGGHTPTTIFKPGYSPVEQYEGTTQGPYTDIYALAATLYRTAFGVRPVDALKRSGEMRLTNNDPLVPADQRGKGEFSDEFLRTIDVALKIDPADRPQTIDEWLKILDTGDQGRASVAPATSNGARTGLWAGIALAVMVAIGVGVYWFSRGETPEALPTDIPSLLARAGTEFSSSPFDETQQDKARQLYLQVLNQDGSNTHALAGLRAANLLHDFSKALESEERADAVVLLDKVESEFKRAGMKIARLDTGWRRLELLNILTTLRSTLPAEPLAATTWTTVEGLITDMQPLPGGDAAAEAARQGLSALRATEESISQQQFAEARANIDRAESLFGELGVAALSAADQLVDEAEARFEAARQAQITALLEQAKRALLSEPLSLDALHQSADLYRQVLALDADHSGAQARATFVGKLVNSFDAIKRGRFGDAAEMLVSAHKVAANAGFSTLPVDRAKALLEINERDWNIAQARNVIHQHLSNASALLDAGPLDPDKIANADAEYEQAASKSAQDPAFEAESETAQSGQRLATALTKAALALQGQSFDAARKAMAGSELLTWARDVGTGPSLLNNAAQLVDAKETQWQQQQASELLRNAPEPWSVPTLDSVAQHAARILELAPGDEIGTALNEGVAALRSFTASRESKAFDDAITALQQAQTGLKAVGIENTTLDQAQPLVEAESQEWERQQREQRIEVLLEQAFAILAESPFSDDTQSTASRAFKAIGALEGGEARARAGAEVLQAIDAAQLALTQARFDAALQAIGRAEQQLISHKGPRLDKARLKIARQRADWVAQQLAEIDAELQAAGSALREQGLSADVIARLNEHFANIKTRYQGADTAAAGHELVRLLEASLAAMNADQYGKAGALLEEAHRQAALTGLDAAVLAQADAQLAGRQGQWTTAQQEQRVLELIASATERVNASPIDDQVLQQATETFSEALTVDKQLDGERSQAARITAALETVFLLRAFGVELAERQFDALAQSLKELRERLPGSGLNTALATQLEDIATQTELKWYQDRAIKALLKGDWVESQDVGAIAEAVERIARIAPEQKLTKHWQQGVQALQQSFLEREQRGYSQALKHLAQAATSFADMGLVAPGLNALREQLTEEEQRWRELSIERDILAWTGQAVTALSLDPFSTQTDERVEGLISAIFTARAGDERGTTLQRAKQLLTEAAEALDAEDYAVARARVNQANETLAALGLLNPLRSATTLIEKQASERYKAPLDAAIGYLDQDPLSDENLRQSRAELEPILQQDPAHPIAAAAAPLIDNILAARTAIAATRYAEATQQIAEGRQALTGPTPDLAPLPRLRKLLDETDQQLARSRPSPAEIYPIISVGLRAITDGPLDPDKLDHAAELLRNALGLQADEEVALNALEVIRHLRTTLGAIQANDATAARDALQLAQQALTSIGLSEATLRDAWQQVNSIRP